MRRLALIFGILLTLTAGVWSSALATDWCLQEASAPVAADEHDCCRARIGESNSHHSESPDDSHKATHGKSVSQDQVAGSHAEMDCGGAEESVGPAKATAVGQQRGSSCFECCASRPGQTPTAATIVAPGHNTVKRVAGNASASAHDLFAPAAPGVSHLAPSQHAPPPTEQRRHILISVFLI